MATSFFPCAQWGDGPGIVGIASRQDFHSEFLVPLGVVGIVHDKCVPRAAGFRHRCMASRQAFYSEFWELYEKNEAPRWAQTRAVRSSEALPS